MKEHPDNAMAWTLHTFDDLGVDGLYAVLRARVDVFVVEQACPYPEIDGLDRGARHLCGWAQEGELAAYARILAPGIAFAEPSIGRVLTVSRFRDYGLGRELMERALAACDELYPGHGTRISAQHRLRSFYESLGFVAEGRPYDEDGIEHIDMARNEPV